MKGVLARLAAALSLAGVLGIGALPVSAAEVGPFVDVANPAAGAYVPRGRLVISGVAYDARAKADTGVDQVTVFLGPRDLGGDYHGTATLGRPNTLGAKNAQFATAGWTFTTKSLRKGSWDLYVYARSSVTGAETVTVIPFLVDRFK